MWMTSNKVFAFITTIIPTTTTTTTTTTSDNGKDSNYQKNEWDEWNKNL